MVVVELDMHALDCRKGSLVIQRHNEIRNALGDLASIAYKEVVRERELNDQENVPALIAVRGVWQPQAATFFDVQVLNSDANSYLHHDVGAVLSSIEHTKKQTNILTSC